MTESSHRLRAVARLVVLIGAVGSLTLLFLNGNGRRQIVLMILFVGWVLLPFVALAAVDKFSARWSAGTRTTLYVVSLVVALCSLAVYGGIITPPAGTKPAAIWLMVPLGSLVLTAAVALPGFLSRERSRP